MSEEYDDPGYVAGLEAKIAALVIRAEKAEGDVRIMVEKAAAKSLDGYRELGARAAAAENERDAARARIEELERTHEGDVQWISRVEQNCGILDERNETQRKRIEELEREKRNLGLAISLSQELLEREFGKHAIITHEQIAAAMEWYGVDAPNAVEDAFLELGIKRCGRCDGEGIIRQRPYGEPVEPCETCHGEGHTVTPVAPRGEPTNEPPYDTEAGGAASLKVGE